VSIIKNAFIFFILALALYVYPFFNLYIDYDNYNTISTDSGFYIHVIS
jgi:hypothetical protein